MCNICFEKFVAKLQAKIKKLQYTNKFLYFRINVTIFLDTICKPVRYRNTKTQKL